MNIQQIFEFVLKTKQTEPSLSTIAKNYKTNIEKAKKETLTLNQALRTLNVKPMTALKTESVGLKTALTRLKEAYKKGEVSARDYARAQVSLRNKMAALKTESMGLSATFTKMKKGLFGLAATGYALGKSFGAFADYTQKMAEVRTLVNASNKDFNTLKDSILNMTRELPQSATELASAEYDIISAGVKLKDSASVLRLSAKAAVAGVTDTKTAVNAGVGILNAYGMSVDKLSGVYDILFATVKDGVTTFPELAQSIGVVAPIARSAGVDVATLGASIAALTKAGIKTPEAVTALRGAIVALSSATPEARKEMDKLGISWEGLIPTLQKLKKYSNDPDLMRKLIPDVRARTAVLALTKNFDSLTNALKDTKNASGAMEEAYKKMEKAPLEQIRLFKNEVMLLAIRLGGLISKGLLPLIKGLNTAMDSFKQLNTPTKIFLETLGGFAALAAVWKLGLGSMVTGLADLIKMAHTSELTIASLRTEITLTQAAATAGIIVVVALAGYNITKLIGQIRSLNDVLKENQRIADRSLRAAQKYKQAKDTEILSTKEYLKLSKEEQKVYSENLKKKMQYYGDLSTAATALSSDAVRIPFLGIPIPLQSAKGKENEENAKKYQKIINDTVTAYKMLANAGKTATVVISQGLQETHKHFVINEADTIRLRGALTKAYNSAIAGVKEWSDKVALYEGKIRQERMSTADLIRSLNRKTMDSEDAWYDKKYEADDKLSKAKKALAKGDYDTAKKLTEQAKGLYRDLATTVTKTTEDGATETVMSLNDTTQTAVYGIKNASSTMQNILTKQKNNAQGMVKDFKEKVDRAKFLMDKLMKPGTKKIDIKIKDYGKVLVNLQLLAKDVTKTIHIKQVTDTTTEKHRFGGLAGYAVGGSLYGYGGGDIIPALLEPGEFILRKESVKKYGVSLLSALNNLSAPVNLVPRFQTGGVVSPTAWFDNIQNGISADINNSQTKILKDLLDVNTKSAKANEKTARTVSVSSHTDGAGLAYNDTENGAVKNFLFKNMTIPINLMNSEVKEWDKFSKIVSQSDWAKYAASVSKFSPGGFNINSLKPMFDDWIKRQKIANSVAINSLEKKEKAAVSKRVAVDLNISNNTYPLEGNKDVVQQLLAEIQKLKAMGYA